MIKSYRGSITEKIHSRKPARGFPGNLYRAAQRKLAILDAATSLNDLAVPPGNMLEKLKGDRKNEHSIRINDQWRICFIWDNGDAYGVEITDYH